MGEGGAVSRKVCAWCRTPKVVAFYRGKREARCPCCHDYRTPIEVRRDAVLEQYGDDPEAYTPAVLKRLAGEGLFDLTDAFCPAGKLSMEETKAREAQGIEAGTAETGTGSVHESPVGAADAPNPGQSSGMPKGGEL
jgi:hypothetical protein